MSKKKRMRLPNGFGQITELKNRNLRNPFRAMVTVDKDDFGKPICKLLKPKSYFRTYNDAYSALMEYHKNPYEIDKDTTMEDLYKKWSEGHFETISESAARTFKSAWSYCSSIYQMKVSDVRVRHLKGCINDGRLVVKDSVRTTSASMKIRIKSMFNMMFDYAVEYELTDKNYARDFNLPKEVGKEEEENKKEHISLSTEEVEILWKNIDIQYVDIVLLQCYSGWRPQELGNIKMEDVDIKNGYFTGGMKTDAGTYRTVPIHPAILNIVKDKYEEALNINSKYLLNCVGDRQRKLTYDKYRDIFREIVVKLNLNDKHRPHDGRNTFITMAKKYKVDEYAIKYMVGHKINDITEKVYTERSREWLKEEIEKIKCDV